MQAVLARDLACHRRHEFKMRRAAGPTAGADHQRNIGGDGGMQHQAQIAADGDRRAERFARAEVMRPGIDAAAIDADDMRLTVHSGSK